MKSNTKFIISTICKNIIKQFVFIIVRTKLEMDPNQDKIQPNKPQTMNLQRVGEKTISISEESS